MAFWGGVFLLRLLYGLWWWVKFAGWVLLAFWEQLRDNVMLMEDGTDRREKKKIKNKGVKKKRRFPSGLNGVVKA